MAVDTIAGKARKRAKALYRVATEPVGSIQELSPAPGQFVLTYDDGPDPRYTPDILNVLSDFGATATFFVLLSKVERHPSLLQEVLAAGHEIALHGLNHQRLTSLTGREVFERSRAGKHRLEDSIGEQVRWLRPPYGAQTVTTWRAIRRADLASVVWSGTFWDWKPMPAEQRFAKATSTARPGVIMLAHDSFPDRQDGIVGAVEPQVERASLARDVLSAYRDKGLEARSLKNAVTIAAPQQWAWFSR